MIEAKANVTLSEGKNSGSTITLYQSKQCTVTLNEENILFITLHFKCDWPLEVGFTVIIASIFDFSYENILVKSANDGPELQREELFHLVQDLKLFFMTSRKSIVDKASFRSGILPSKLSASNGCVYGAGNFCITYFGLLSTTQQEGLLKLKK